MTYSNENTAAHHLHTLLAQVRVANGTIAEAWAGALDTEWGTHEFARRHSEVVSLLQMTIRQLSALPERSRIRCERHVSAWWTAVMQPVVNWMDTNRSPLSVIDEDKLDHLESTAELISGNLAGSDAAPRGGDLHEMTQRCEEWIELLTSMGDEEIEGPIRDQLISQLRHLIWLAGHAGIFGGARVAEEASTVIGSLARTGATLVNMQEGSQTGWKKALLALVAACVVFNTAAPIFQESITAGAGFAREIANVVHDAQANE
ncbi:hypothetical protein AB0F11_25870 [Streptomyces sp. NPDC032472]|uniref:hypothetical protein n=1 Tax=Streptomyces sp. NPDC032472 TaxID=3155018 RepID=UPI00340B8486